MNDETSVSVVIEVVVAICSNQTLSFEGSRLLPKDEHLYVLKECPAALSISKTVIDGGHLFVWDPRKNQPHLVAQDDLHRCKMRVPRSTRINASRVVEHVPQFDEQLQPRFAPYAPSLPPFLRLLKENILPARCR